MTPVSELIHDAPWTVEPGELPGLFCVRVTHRSGLSMTMDAEFCESEANVIAAAPDMYESLYDAVGLYCSTAEVDGSGDRHACRHLGAGLSCNGTEYCPCRKWRNALAKATGYKEKT